MLSIHGIDRELEPARLPVVAVLFGSLDINKKIQHSLTFPRSHISPENEADWGVRGNKWLRCL